MNSDYIPNEYEPIAENFAGRDRPTIETRLHINPWLWVYLLWILLIFVGLVWVADAQDDRCEDLPSFIVGTDLTAYVYQDGYEYLFETPLAYSPHNGFYNWRGVWVVLNQLEDGNYRIWAGTDWTVGTDGQLHNPTCYLIVDDHYEWYFGLHPKRWYPTGELYQ